MSSFRPTSTASRSSSLAGPLTPSGSNPAAGWRLAAGGRLRPRHWALGLAFFLALNLSADAGRPQLAPAQVQRLETEALHRRAADRIRALRKEAEALASRERSMLGELRRLEVERDLRTEEYERDTRDLADTEQQIAEASALMEKLQEQAKAQVPGLSARLVELYKLGQAGYVRLMLGVDDLREMGRAYRFVSALQILDAQRVQEHRRTLADLTVAITGLQQKRERLGTLREEARRSKLEAERAAAAREALIAQIDATRDMNARWVADLQAAQQQLQDALARMAATGGRPGDSAPSLPLRPFRGAIDWPADGRVVTRFGLQRNARFNTAIIRNGVEISVRANAPVFAIHDGNVAFAGIFTGFGNLVIVDHGNQAYSLYGNLADMSVKPGAHVARGQSVGSMGASLPGASAGGPLVYFELRIDGKPVDPVEWLKKR